MWSVVGWLSAVCWGGIVVALLTVIVKGNGYLRVQTRLMLELFLVLATLIFLRDLFSASMEDLFQQALEAMISGHPMRLNRNDTVAFILWRNFRRAEMLWSVFTLICFIPYSYWRIDEWARERGASNRDQVVK